MIKLLHDLELLQLIRVRKEKTHSSVSWDAGHKGAMTKQKIQHIDNKLINLRYEWK
jgi:hypothetical protein